MVRGIVQGVGFRPFIYLLAHRRALKGKVFNNASGVLIDVEGEAQAIAEFVNEIKLNPPPLSIIESVELDNLPIPANFKDFRIVESESNGAKFVPISADIASCADCLREMFDPNDRRFRYPFINCTNCGPRFTIIENVPYDREQTTMHEFAMCNECRAEYENPLDRRFHAEPIACANCGPKVFLRSSEIEPQKHRNIEEIKDAIEQAKQLLENGKILAVKGIGGFHLVCDALNAKAVQTLRKRKYREDKPFALMANSIKVIEKYCFVSETEKYLLLSKQRPIVLLEKKPDAEIPEAIAPKAKNLGFMLPYTPLHVLLLENLEKPLVMTSGNVSDEPICFEDEDANERLNKIADYYLFHNRRINIRTDDSVVRVLKLTPQWRSGAEEETQPQINTDEHRLKEDKSEIQNPKSKIILRRSRGYAPTPINAAFKFEKQILACGAELKNTFCITKENYAFLSHHIGDLENLETLKSFTEGIKHFKRLFNLEPEIIAYDLHPEYLSTKYALALDEKLAKIGVQHHHAHIASCLADNEIDGEVIGVAFDGLGLGTDGKLWGGEFFVADFTQAERIAHLEYVPMPGGAKAIREPWRMAAAYLQRAFGDDFVHLEIPFIQNLNQSAWKILRQMIQTEINSPQTSSMGRLFDGVASLLSLRNTVNYEGQAAIELEVIAEKSCSDRYFFEIAEDKSMIKVSDVIKKIAEDLMTGVSPQIISTKFHLGVAHLITLIAREIRDERNLNRVALSGGVFQNLFLLAETCRILKSDGFEVFTHSRVPTNDGGISLGQAAIANARIMAGRI